MGEHAPERAGDAVLAAIAHLAARIRELEPAARSDAPDAVHQLRTHVRRLRSVLAAYRPLFDGARVDDLRRTYARYGEELGRVRDLEVRARYAEEALKGLPDAPAAMRVRLVDDVRAEYSEAHARLAELMTGPGADARARMLDAFCADPRFTARADLAAVPMVGALLADEAHRAMLRAMRADSSPERLHRARKAARRLRYAAEAVSEPPTEVLGERARQLAAAGEAIHDLLGDHRDALIFAEHARRVGGAHARTHADLAAGAEAVAAGHLRRYPAAVRRLRGATGAFVAGVD
ncbi:CHAD domain-containing protein [Agromyces sp. SYSU T00194]|uniref:CHAD domain-containing protein n=1 Tax=Agromyces chitinivorans TaxID=3158560 RepID=UPI0033989A41